MGIPLRPNNIVAKDINNYNNLENKQTSIGHNNLVENVMGPKGPMGLGPVFLTWGYFKVGTSCPHP